MKFKIAHCAVCGEPPVAIVERVLGNAFLCEPDDTGDQNYMGETEIEWDTQETDTDADGDVEVFCDKHHFWKTAIVETPE